MAGMEAMASSAKKPLKRGVLNSALLREVFESSDEEPDHEESEEVGRSSKKRGISEEEIYSHRRAKVGRHSRDGGRLERDQVEHMAHFESENERNQNSEHADPSDFDKEKDSASKNQGTDKGRESAKRRKRQSLNVPENSGTGSANLIDIVKHQGKSVQRAAKSWVERYESNPEPALIELITFLFEGCGVKLNLQTGSLDEADVDDIVLKLVLQAKEGNLEDLLGSKQRELRSFKENLLSFWDALVRECQDGPLFDQKLMDKCMDFVIAISCTPPRIFRHMTTVVGLQLVTSLVAVAKTLGESRETAQRQLNAEKKKRKEGPRVESLNKVLSVTHEKITKVEEMMRKIFTGLFMHRYRDVDPEIRMACIQAIGSWIVSYPSLFLRDFYLKYLGWTLNDKNAAVRRSSIEALQALYEVEDNVPSLGLFTERFCNRMIELADDIDVHVAVSAVGLLKRLLRHQLIGDEDLGPLYDLLIDESPFIRHAIGELVYEHLIAQKHAGSQAAAGDHENEDSEAQLKRLLLILKEFSNGPVICEYVIDALWDEMKAMKDWKSLTSMLLDDGPRMELTDKDSTNLCRVLCASVKKAVGEKIVPTHESRKATLTKVQKEALESHKKEMTTVMIKSHSKLLRKYLADKAKVTYVVEILMYTKLELYSLKQQEQNFSTSLQLTKDAFFKHGDDNTLRACVKALAFCANESHADLQDTAQRILKETSDELLLKLRSAILQAGESDDEYSLTVYLRRLHQLQLTVPVTNENLYKDLLGLLQDFHNLDDEVIRLVLTNMFLHVIWSMKALDLDNPEEAAMSELLSKRAELMKYLHFYANSVLDSFKEGHARNLLGSTVCILLSDLWSLFSEEKLNSTKLESLGFCPPEDLLQTFWKLCEQRLLSTDNGNEEEDVTDEPAGYLNQKDVIISAAAKLIAHDMVPKDFLGPEIVSHYVLHGKSVDETVRQLIVILRKNMKSEDLCNLYLEAMKRAYNRHMQEVSAADEDFSKGESILACKELASRLSATFAGFARNMHRASILKLVKGGIAYAFIDAPKQLPFLEAAVIQFAHRLPVPDVRDILEKVQTQVRGIDTDQDPSGWRPYFTFVDSLQEKLSRVEAPGDRGVTGSRQPQSRGRKRKDIKGKKLFEGHDEIDHEDEPSESEEHEEHDEEDEDDDTPLFQVRQSMKAAVNSHAKSRKADDMDTLRSIDEEDNEGNRALAETRRSPGVQEADSGSSEARMGFDTPLYGSATATEEQLPT
ncbi:hypothetical protein O6H91_02G036400 [Diphasiastrum complanatum]|uniref:Uncharacterized protein n=3 Tax=Diphasiastrum complanatum TaxID=34168 RepID=A0ACC2EEM6_DIPCM|nr:hypothetical protein O6H91_02G036400 [Diphasiastrum complanatum]KAJ7564850.1 hypothetical protein O6H91_02G036400 [Diphasiastrum complanatum]KAJ7564851.1 hypothetical protein O6H91_02G036400 [Diphasiastrum complanatum]